MAISSKAAAAGTTDYTAQIMSTRVMKEPLIWVGKKAPSQAESKALWSICEAARTDNDVNVPEEFENYIASYPNSPWVPSLQANLAYDYRLTGRYSGAMKDWQAAWNATRHYQSGPGKQVADFTLANWSRLLSSLGRVQELKKLSAEAGNRKLGRLDWQESWIGALNALNIMEKDPGVAYRCGTLALSRVAQILHPSDTAAIRVIANTPSPTTGFSMSSLMGMVKRFHLGMVAMHRDSGDELVAPSVVHWKQDHYAAIVEERGDYFLVMDPTFGRPQWLTRQEINSEASGDFLIPAGQAPEGWRPLTKAETDLIYGRGVNSVPPLTEPPPCDAQGQSTNKCSKGKAPCPHCCSPPGMPTWWVSEPYMSLWLEDTPMVHQTSIGLDFPLRLYYYQRETRPILSSIVNFGPDWDCNWLSYIHVTDPSGDPTFGLFNATLYGSGGGQLVFNADPTDYNGQGNQQWSGYPAGSSGGTDVHPDAAVHATLSRILVTNVDESVTCIGFKESYSDGSQAIYTLPQVIQQGSMQNGNPAESLFFLTARIDAQGRVTHFNYSTNNNLILLTSVIDCDGNSYTFQYDSAISNQVDEIDGPNGSVDLAYDTNGMLTNITDVAGMHSSFQYMFTNGIPELTNMCTPYGNTAFSYYQPTGSLVWAGNGGDSGVDRAVKAVQPDGGMYMYAYYENQPSFFPWSYATTPSGIPVNDPPDGIINYLMYYHNSVAWDPRQCLLLSTTNISQVQQLTTNDINLGRLRNWLNFPPTGLTNGTTVSGEICMERAPSPDGVTSGQMTWYGYSDLTNGPTDSDVPDYGIGVDNFEPDYIAAVLPNGQTRYSHKTFNFWGYPTQKISTYSVGSQVDLRTNTYIYADNNIDLVQVIGPDGVTNASYGYNDLHQMVAATNALGEVTTYTYAPFANSYSTNSQLTSITYPSGLVTTNIYNSSGFLIETYDYADTGSGIVYYRTNYYTYDNGNVYTHTDPRGLTVTNTWDALDRLRGVSYPDGTFITNVYDRLDIVQTVDRMGFTNSYGYDPMRRLTAWTNALGNVTTYSYCTCGALESRTDPLGNPTTFSYDNQGRLTQITYPNDLYTINYNYNSVGEVTNIYDSSGASYNYSHDNQGLVTAIDSAAGQLAAYGYDINDRITNFVNHNGVSLGIAYDDLWRPLSITYPDTGVESWGYTPDMYGATSYTNQIGDVTLYNYDPSYRETNDIQMGVTTNTFTYDGADDLLTLTDGNGHTTTWGYDQFGRVTNKVDDAGYTDFAYQYDADNRLTNRWSADNITTAYGYDAAGNLTSVNYSGGTNYTSPLYFTYDADNRLISMDDAVGTTYFTYDALGELLSAGGLWPDDTVTYTYQNRLRASLSIATPAGTPVWTQDYSYDSIRRLASVSSPAGQFDYTYLASYPSTLISRLSLPNGAYITNTYDAVARLLSTKLLDSGLSTLDSYAYAYNHAGQRTGVTRTLGDYVNYTYDNAGQLVTAQGYEADTTPRLQEQLWYGYDAAGNLVQRSDNALFQTFNVNDLNELTTIHHTGTLTVAGATTAAATGVTVNGLSASLYADDTFASTNQTVNNAENSYTAIAQDSNGRKATNTVNLFISFGAHYIYDANGNLTSEWSPNGGTNRIFSYNGENELVSVMVTNAWREGFVYDGLMRRRITRQYIWSAANGDWQETNEIHYIYDGNTVVQERDAINLPMVTYTRGNDLSGSLQGAGGIGGLLARTMNSDLLSPTTQPQASSYYHSDGNGNITMMIDGGQNMVARYLYGPYGNLLGMWGPLAAANTYRFSSKAWDENAGIYYYGYRFYDPNLQRWLNRDPIQEWGGINLYAFVLNNAVSYIDPLGLDNNPDSPWAQNGISDAALYAAGHVGAGYAEAAVLANLAKQDQNNPNNPNDPNNPDNPNNPNKSKVNCPKSTSPSNYGPEGIAAAVWNQDEILRMLKGLRNQMGNRSPGNEDYDNLEQEMDKWLDRLNALGEEGAGESAAGEGAADLGPLGVAVAAGIAIGYGIDQVPVGGGNNVGTWLGKNVY